MRQITKLELDQILKDHRLWLNSGYHEGARAHLEDADLRGMNLQGADLRGADLLRANLRDANLQDADLRDANLWRADLRGADLWGADLLDSDLRGAQLDTNIRHCHGFERARCTADALPWLILHPRWAEMQKTVRILEAVE